MSPTCIKYLDSFYFKTKNYALILFSVMLNTFVSNFLSFLFTSIYMIILHQNFRTSCNYKAHKNSHVYLYE